MKKGIHKFIYKRIMDGRGCYGALEMEIIPAYSSSIVKYVSDERLPEEWKNAALNSMEIIIDKCLLSEPIEIRIGNIHGMAVDSMPVEFAVVASIAFFDIMNKQVSYSYIQAIDEFVRVSKRRPHYEQAELEALLLSEFKTK